jgi:hypothetical protein
VFFAVEEDNWSLVSESYFLLAPLELGTVDPDAIQNDSELAGDGGFGFLDADAFGQPHTPSLHLSPKTGNLCYAVSGSLII